ncbi:hypothetical protein DIPPA_35440 [Diplonema papillatum]|nr:hypothetical protein DIPPA_35440 [Diplonema papillatum]
MRWTPLISVGAGTRLACEDYEYLAEFRCSDLDCTSIKLGCIPLPSHCIFLQSASVDWFRRADSSPYLTGSEWLSQDGYVLHGIQCQSENCGSFSPSIRQLSSTLPWTSFSEENKNGNEGASSLNAKVPIVGLSCSGDHCDDKQVLSMPTSTCVGTPGVVRWTPYFTTLNSPTDDRYTSCEDYEYVARIECQGDYCANMRLGCIAMAAHCSFTTGPDFKTIESGGSWLSQQGYVLWSIQCSNDWCGTLSIGYRQLSSTTTLQWSPSFSEEQVDGDEDCADKKVLQISTSSCIVSGAAVRWTQYFSDGQASYTQCEDYEYVARIQCRGVSCSSMRLGCVAMAQHCSFDTSPFFQDVSSGESWMSGNGYVLWSVQCKGGDLCPTPTVGFRKLTNTQWWSSWFSEEDENGNGGASPDVLALIVGLSCGGDHCDNKKVLQLKESSCIVSGGAVRWTDYFSSLDVGYTSCEDHEYVYRIQCQGDNCASMRLGCVYMASHCTFATGPANQTIGTSGSWWLSQQGYVLWSIQCSNDWCGTLKVGYRQLTNSLQWSPSFSSEEGSPDNNVPIAGLLCSGEDCADKKVLQRTTSSCIVSEAAIRWTQYFTSLDDISTSCEDYEYVARIECQGVSCSSMRLGCVAMAQHCVFDTSPFFQDVSSGESWMSDSGYLWSVQCKGGDLCPTLTVGFRRPTNSKFNTQRWSSWFSEEDENGNAGASPDVLAPIVGLSCGGDHCDNKRVLQLKESSCIVSGGAVRWTQYFTSSDHSYTSCEDHEYVYRIQCQGDNCDTIRLGCVYMAPHCSFATGPDYKEIESGGSWLSQQGYVLWSIQCSNDWCGTLKVGYRQLTNTLQWSPSFSYGASPDINAPIAGLLCSGEDCADKKVLQRTTSSCIDSGAAMRWTPYFSDVQASYTKCEDYEYVARIQCRGVSCSSMSLGCVAMAQHCVFDTSPFFQDVSSGESWMSDSGYLWSVQCKGGDLCPTLTVGFRRPTNTQRWSSWFSEEDENGNGGASPDVPAPIVGLSCDGDRCDNKRVLQMKESSCILSGGAVRWTDYFTSSDSYTSCEYYEYVYRIQCQGDNCANIRLGCVAMASHCSFNDNRPSVRTIGTSGSWWLSQQGYVLWSIQCSHDKCGTLNVGFRQLTNTLKWSAEYDIDSPYSISPIVGVSCKNSCAFKQVAHARSSCTPNDGTGVRWTPYFSAASDANKCEDYEYISRIDCSGTLCSQLRLGCVAFPSHCAYVGRSWVDSIGGYSIIYDESIATYENVVLSTIQLTENDLHMQLDLTYREITDDIYNFVQWSPWFSEENVNDDEGASPNSNAPIVGLSCGGNHCDNKQVVQMKESSCIVSGATVRWTDYFTSSNGKPTSCKDNEYVARIQCRGDNCDNMRLGCVAMASHCSFSDNGPGTREIGPSGSWWLTQQGYVLWSIECQKDWCGTLIIGYRQLSKYPKLVISL